MVKISTNEKLVNLAKLIGLEISQDIYEGDKEKFLTFTIQDSRCVEFADDIPKKDIDYVMIQYHAPFEYNYIKDVNLIKKELFKMGFTYPSHNVVYDENAKKRRIVMQTEIEGD